MVGVDVVVAVAGVDVVVAMAGVDVVVAVVGVDVVVVMVGVDVVLASLSVLSNPVWISTMTELSNSTKQVSKPNHFFVQT